MEINLNKYIEIITDRLIMYGPKILLGIAVFLIGQWLIRKLKLKLKDKISDEKVNSSARPFIQNIVVVVLQLFLLMFVMQFIGIRLTIFTTVIAASGAALTLALSGTLQNFACGLIIIFLKPFVIGDNIVAQGLEGTVLRIQLFYTVLLTYDKRTVIMPNSKLSNEIVVNITRSGSRRLDIELKLNYKVGLSKVKNQLIQTINDDKAILTDPAMRIGVSSFTENGYTLLLSIWLKAHGFEDARLAFQEKVAVLLSEINNPDKKQEA